MAEGKLISYRADEEIIERLADFQKRYRRYNFVLLTQQQMIDRLVRIGLEHVEKQLDEADAEVQKQLDARKAHG